MDTLQKFRERCLTFAEHVPDRLEAFDVLNVPPTFWPSLYILDVDHGDRLLVRVTGTQIDASLSRNCKGLHMDDIMHGPKSPEVLAAFRRCRTEGVRLIMSEIVAFSDRPAKRVVGAAFPLRGEGDAIDHIIGLLEFAKLGPTRVQNTAFQSFTF